MKCPVCGNTMGFAFGTCIDCGFNHITNEFQSIRVDTEILKNLVSEETFDWLVAEHYRWKKDVHNHT